jgi:N-acetylneuraminate synthase/sialic acid synthase
MRQLRLENQLISDITEPFIIAEIGHNHQGNLDVAVEMIKSAALSGASAVKFQKRSNKSLFIPSAFNEPYNSENSYGVTYGLHREALEFGKDEYEKCIHVANENNISFFATPFDFESVDFLEDLGIGYFKIASCDIQNLPLLKYVAKLHKPMIISTGGSNFEMIKRAVAAINEYHNDVAILQCTASYPANYSQLNLNVIAKLRTLYPENVIGYSGHENGIAMPIVAYTLGARIIEKHFTLNRTMKGTDHSFSLEPQGLKKMVRDLKRAKLALGDGDKIIYESEIAPIKKMSKMIVASRDLSIGEIINEKDFEFRSPGNGLPPSFYEFIVGKKTKVEIKKYEAIKIEMIN